MDASAHRVHRSTSIEEDDFMWRNGSNIVAERSVALTVWPSVRRLGVEVVCLNFIRYFVPVPLPQPTTLANPHTSRRQYLPSRIITNGRHRTIHS